MSNSDTESTIDLTSPTKTPIDLYEIEDYAGAVRLLRDQAALTSDKDKVLLTECLFRLKDYQGSLEAFGTISSPTSDHFEVAGICCLRSEDYESAEKFFYEALKRKAHPNTYYLLALAFARNQNDFQLDAQTKKNICDVLAKATLFTACPIEAYLWFESLHKYEEADIEARVELLERAVLAYPNSEEARVRLASWHTHRLGKPDYALEILQPLMQANTTSPHVWMKAYSAARETRDLAAALKYLEIVAPTDDASRINLNLLKADLHLELHEYDEALTCYSEVAMSNAADLKVISMFGKARAHLALLNQEEAREEARNGAQLFLDSDLYLTSYDPVFIESEAYGYEFLAHMKAVISHYLENSTDQSDPGMIGALNYVSYEITLEDADAEEEPDSNLLVRAHELNSHPRISRGLASYFVQQKKWALGVTHHLAYCLWTHKKKFHLNTDTSFLSEVEEHIPTIRKAERAKITRVVAQQLNEYLKDDAVVRDVLEPFYRQFWRQLLFKDDMSATVVEIAEAIINSGSANNVVLWDYAYHLARLGKSDLAMSAYAELLESQPKNASALHNLSLLKETKGFFADAVELSSRAASIAPDDTLIVRRYEQLKEKSKKIQIQKQTARPKVKKAPDDLENSGASLRKGISKKIRFEVFKRDSFTCQYCGRKAPDVVLEADHIEPSSKGGTGDILNLVTSCKDCNAGKSDRRLSDNSVVEKQRKQLAEMQERKEQIEMMLQWQRDLTDLDAQTVNQVADLWADLVNPFALTQNGKVALAKLLKHFPLNEVMEAIRIAVAQYIEYEGDSPTKESVEKAWGKIGGICRVARVERDKPYMRDLYYIRGILRNRLSYTRDWDIMKMLERIVVLGGNIEDLRTLALEARSWTQWKESMEELLDQMQTRPGTPTVPEH